MPQLGVCLKLFLYMAGTPRWAKTAPPSPPFVAHDVRSAVQVHSLPPQFATIPEG